jgi:hypothetical protein
MKIDDNHMYHGAALIQIAEDQRFTSINAFSIKGETINNVFRINEDIAVFLKYATKTIGTHEEFVFTFTAEVLEQLDRVSDVASTLVLGMVCIAGRHICAVPYETLMELIRRRKRSKKADENQYTLLITLPERKEFRVYVSPAGKKGQTLGSPILIPRKAFPSAVFR